VGAETHVAKNGQKGNHEPYNMEVNHAKNCQKGNHAKNGLKGNHEPYKHGGKPCQKWSKG
jgi:hypothetical protein